MKNEYHIYKFKRNNEPSKQYWLVLDLAHNLNLE